MIVVAAIAVLGAVLVETSLLSARSAAGGGHMAYIVIRSGMTEKEIGAELQQKHLVRRGLGFVLAARLDGLSGKMKSGRYQLSSAMTPQQMAALIALGKTAPAPLVVPEGFTVAQIAKRLAAHGDVDENEFLRLAQTNGRSFHVDGFTPPNNNLEGYLFPDTYDIPKGTGARDIIAMMLKEFSEKVIAPRRAEFPSDKVLQDTVTMASLVEREAEVDSDRPLVAAALSNRLKIGMRLQCDATVQYALPGHKTRLFYKDLRVESPYNTYLHAGLPPTPIANPGVSSIEAALHPAQADYLYYVARPDGRHIFTATLADHNRAVAQMRAARASQL
ncbi:aminodeoxychorismate lyase [Capsulimonas corticalis]|uniref:Endolytic murein transglycosylase n=1 Tax=Capsulimonas corticalis TaxID=2219043 RepID=A0A402CPS1_9BACT|nr:aminodeoxychorismate lyase [Capsulimonas corticalis]